MALALNRPCGEPLRLHSELCVLEKNVNSWFAVFGAKILYSWQLQAC